MKYFLDTEFYEDGKIIDLISIGIVSEDGRELYCVNQDAKLHLVSPWVRQNVLPHLPRYSSKSWMKYESIKQEIIRFVFGNIAYQNISGEWQNVSDKNPMFYGYYADYDWVVFCQLFGTMMDLPDLFPKFCMDLKQLSVMVGSPRHPKQNGIEHNALTDARYTKELYEFLTNEFNSLFSRK